MSGGHFDYSQYQIDQIAETIKSIIINNDSQELDEYGCRKGRDYSPEVIAKFREAVAILSRAYVYAHRIDWLLSGDDGEDNFLSRLAEELEQCDRNNL